MPCQSGRSAAALAIALAAAPAAAGSASWAHQAGSLSSNGSVTVKSLAGGSYSAMQNPAGAVAKASQNAATQPPTVVIQATGSSLPFNYKDDCYIFYPPSGAGFADQSSPRIGMGKLDGSNQFTGLIAAASGIGATVLIGQMTGVSAPGNGLSGYDVPGRFYWSGSDAGSSWQNSQTSGNYSHYWVVGVTALSVRSPSKCYP